MGGGAPTNFQDAFLNGRGFFAETGIGVSSVRETYEVRDPLINITQTSTETATTPSIALGYRYKRFLSALNFETSNFTHNGRKLSFKEPVSLSLDWLYAKKGFGTVGLELINYRLKYGGETSGRRTGLAARIGAGFALPVRDLNAYWFMKFFTKIYLANFELRFVDPAGNLDKTITFNGMNSFGITTGIAF